MALISLFKHGTERLIIWHCKPYFSVTKVRKLLIVCQFRLFHGGFYFADGYERHFYPSLYLWICV